MVAVIYTGRVRREGKFWVIEIPTVGVTQARRLSEIEAMARDLVAIMSEADAAEVQVDLKVEVGDAQAELEEARRLRSEASRMQETAAKASNAVAHRLHDAGLSINDVGTLLGLSYQRIHQLLAK